METHYRPNTRLRGIRKERGMTQEAFAALIGVDRRTVQRWESGESTPSAYARQQLSSHLQATPANLGLLAQSLEEERQEQVEEALIRRLQGGTYQNEAQDNSSHGKNTFALVVALLAGSLLVASAIVLVVAIRLVL